MTATDWSVALSLGVVSSLHCAGMCGPLVIAFSAAAPRGAVLPHLAYHAGRIVTYSLLGAVAGMVGNAAAWLGHVAGVERGVALASGLLIVISGIAMARITDNAGLVKIGGVHPAWGPVRGLIRKLGPCLLSPTATSKFGLGLGLGFLPCGLVYAALVKAAAAGTPVDGAATMAAFGAGTMGALLAIGLFSAGLRAPLARHGTRFAALCVIALGLASIWRGWAAAGPMNSGSAAGAACHVSGHKHGS